jgi:hypothetical protein
LKDIYKYASLGTPSSNSSLERVEVHSKRMFSFLQRRRIIKRLEKIKKVKHWSRKTLAWFKEPLPTSKRTLLAEYLRSFRFEEDEVSQLRSFLQNALMDESLSFNDLTSRDKHLQWIRQIFLQSHTTTLFQGLLHKIRTILLPFFTTWDLIQSDDDTIRAMSIFFFYPIYSIFPIVSSSSSSTSGGSEESLFLQQLQKVAVEFIQIPNANFQFSIACYLLIDKYMDDKDLPHQDRHEFLFFCLRTFEKRECVIPETHALSKDYLCFKTFYDAFVELYPHEEFDYIHQFVLYLFHNLKRSSVSQTSVRTDMDLVCEETFSKSFLTIYFFNFMSNLTLRGQDSEMIFENAQKAFLIQCYDDFCDLFQDQKNQIKTIFTLLSDPTRITAMETTVENMFLKNIEFLYDRLHARRPILCRTLVYLLLHVHAFLVYKNRTFLSAPFRERYYARLYYDENLLCLFRCDLFESTRFLERIVRRFVLAEGSDGSERSEG